MNATQRRNPANQPLDDRQPELWKTPAKPPEPAVQPAVFKDETARIDERLQALTHSRFRMGWHLKAQQVRYIHEKGINTIARHCDEMIAARLAPASIPNDGSQTPMKGHPVFIAQHATGTCCRSCLKKWHHIAPGTAFTPAQQHYVTTLIMTWIQRQLRRWHPPSALSRSKAADNPLRKPRWKKNRPPLTEPTADLFD